MVWAQVAEGKSNTQIAAELHLSESTIKFHLRHLFAKLGVSNRNEAAAHYHRRGADTPGSIPSSSPARLDRPPYPPGP